jgi:hypothetical protein
MRLFPTDEQYEIYLRDRNNENYKDELDNKKKKPSLKDRLLKDKNLIQSKHKYQPQPVDELYEPD